MIITLEAAKIYCAGVFKADAWNSASDSERTKALNEASQIIGMLSFEGGPYPHADEAIPQSIQYAACEIAIALLDGVDPELEYENQSMVSTGIGSVRSTYDRSQAAPHIIAGVPSIKAWRMLLPYLKESGAVKISRVS